MSRRFLAVSAALFLWLGSPATAQELVHFPSLEDNGPGPTPLDREHLFDPFYSGRKAGRGPGLGLPAAWQLARQHGGDVRHSFARYLSGRQSRFR